MLTVWGVAASAHITVRVLELGGKVALKTPATVRQSVGAIRGLTYRKEQHLLLFITLFRLELLVVDGSASVLRSLLFKWSSLISRLQWSCCYSPFLQTEALPKAALFGIYMQMRTNAYEQPNSWNSQTTSISITLLIIEFLELWFMFLPLSHDWMTILDLTQTLWLAHSWTLLWREASRSFCKSTEAKHVWLDLFAFTAERSSQLVLSEAEQTYKNNALNKKTGERTESIMQLRLTVQQWCSRFINIKCIK